MKKKIRFLVIATVLFFVCKYVYEMNIRHNIETITEGKVYKSGVIPPDEIADFVEEFKIKSIIDLRFPGTNDLVNNPENPEELKAEIAAIQKIKGLRYYNDGSDQVPTLENLDKFFKIMDDKTNYPVLIHCYHGVGRAELYSAIYRIEYENWSNEDARKGIRFLIKWGAFDDGKPKGEFLKAYKSRKELALKKK